MSISHQSRVSLRWYRKDPSVLLPEATAEAQTGNARPMGTKCPCAAPSSHVLFAEVRGQEAQAQERRVQLVLQTGHSIDGVTILTFKMPAEGLVAYATSDDASSREGALRIASEI